jgi:membrane-associated phospholipid phosphatase
VETLWTLDQAAFRAVHEGLRRAWLDPVFVTLADSGLGHTGGVALLAVALRGKWPQWAVLALGIAGAVVAGLVERDPTASAATLLLLGLYWHLPRPAALCGLVCGAAAGLVRLPIVAAMPRLRPSNLPESAPLEAVYAATSFPSGHATTAFAVAAAVAWAVRSGEEAWLGWAAFGWAALVGLSRVYVGVHFPSDVIAGAGLGIAVGTVGALVWRSKGWLAQTTSTAGA